MTKHAIVRLDNMSGTTDGSKIISAKFFDEDDAKAVIDNGSVVALTDTLLDREVYKVTTPAGTETKVGVGLVASVEMIYDESITHGLEDFENSVDDVIRVYALEAGDEFSVTAEAISGTPAKGKYVKLTADSTKWTIADAATGAIGIIVAVEVVDADTYYVIKVK